MSWSVMIITLMTYGTDLIFDSSIQMIDMTSDLCTCIIKLLYYLYIGDNIVLKQQLFHFSGLLKRSKYPVSHFEYFRMSGETTIFNV